MSLKVYTSVATVMKYAYILLAAAIAGCAAQWMRSYRQRHVLQNGGAQGARIIGTLTVVNGESPNLKPGDEFDLPVEGTIGRSYACDIRVRHQDMPARAARFQLKPGGVAFYPSMRECVVVNGREYDAPVTVANGGRAQWGGVTMRLTLTSEAYDSIEMTRGEAAAPVAKAPARKVRPANAAPAIDANSIPNDPPVKKKRVLKTLNVGETEE